MNEFEFETLLNDVVAEKANLPVPAGLAARIKARSFTHFDREAGMSAKVLTFGTLDRIQDGQQTRKTAIGAVMLHAAVLALLFVQFRAMHNRMSANMKVESEVMLSAPPAPLTPSPNRANGGGGHAGAAPVARGNPPKFSERPLMAPQIHQVEDAKLALDPRVAVQPNLKMAKSDLPQLGMPNGSNVGISLGSGGGAGFGSGNGNGVGPGSSGNAGGGYKHLGSGITPPVVLFEPTPEFSEEARKAKADGNVLVYLIVDEQGRPTHIRVLQGIGMGLDEKAIEAAQQYRFKPAMENGKPVAVDMRIEVTFHIY